MKTAADDLRRFHLLGRASGGSDATGLVPAVLAPYRDLSSLRYDYPLVLTDDPPFVHTLTDVIDRALQQVAPRGAAGERMRHHVLRLEGALRSLTHEREGSLADLWAHVTRDLLSSGDADELAADLELAKGVIAVDGPLVGCDPQVAARVLEHVWRSVQDRASRRSGRRIDELVLGLSDILRADDERSTAGRSPEHLAASLGGAHRSAFDFQTWSDILRSTPQGGSLSVDRRARIEWALAALRGQRFFPRERGESARQADRYQFHFRSCAAAIEAYRRRLPAMVELVGAMAIAELELENRYRDDEHDRFFEELDGGSLTRQDLELFPSYLVTVCEVDVDADERAQLFDLLGSDAPIDVLVEIGDVLGDLPPTNGHPTPDAHGRQLATMAMALGTAYVVQTATSHLPQMRDRLIDGVAFGGPALFSVFTGAIDHVRSVPPYLSAAAAVQSRAIPAFSFDPGAGPDWSERLRLEPNPQPDALWPTIPVAYEDAELQRRSEMASFSVIDYAAIDRRFAGHFALAPVEGWSDDMAPAAEQIGLDDSATGDVLPYILMASSDDMLHRVVVDRRLIRAARHVRDGWHSLQELAGIHNSHARALLEIERQKWEEQKAREFAELGARVAPGADATDDVIVDAVGAEVEPLAPSDEPDGQPPPSDEPFIETARCTTCDECTKLNPRMFAYDDNKQAYIADLSAGSYREMVMAAEACQVAIIHPGKPWDPSEPGLDELVARAAAFC